MSVATTSRRSEQRSRELRVREFVGQRCVLGSTLVCPIRLLFYAYRDWCQEHGHEDPRPEELVSVLEKATWAHVSEPRGRGRLRVVVKGVGVRPQ